MTVPKSAVKSGDKAAKTASSAKRPLWRSLRSVPDLARAQAKLLRQFLSGELDEKTYRAAVYGCSVLCMTMRSIPTATNDRPLEVRLFGDVDLGSYPGAFGSGTTVEEYNEAMRALSEES